MSHSLEAGCHNPLPGNTCDEGDARRLRACTTSAAIDPDLARLIDAWPDLAPPIRAAMLAMVASATGAGIAPEASGRVGKTREGQRGG